MGLYKRGTVHWYSTAVDGRLVRKSTKQTNKKKAELFYAEILKSVQTGHYVPVLLCSSTRVCPQQ